MFNCLIEKAKPYWMYGSASFSLAATIVVCLLTWRCQQLKPYKGKLIVSCIISSFNDVYLGLIYAPVTLCSLSVEESIGLGYLMPVWVHQSTAAMLFYLKMAAHAYLFLEGYWFIRYPKLKGNKRFILAGILLITAVAFVASLVFSAHEPGNESAQTCISAAFGSSTTFGLVREWASQADWAYVVSMIVLAVVLCTFIANASIAYCMAVKTAVHANQALNKTKKPVPVGFVRLVWKMSLISFVTAVGLFVAKLAVGSNHCDDGLMNLLHSLSALQSPASMLPLVLFCTRQQRKKLMDKLRHAKKHFCKFIFGEQQNSAASASHMHQPEGITVVQ